MMNYSEMRKYERYYTIKDISIEDIDGNVLLNAYTFNISEGGVCVLCDQGLQKELSYKLIFQIESEDEPSSVSVLSKMVYQHPFLDALRTGFEFADHQDLERVKNLVARIKLEQN